MRSVVLVTAALCAMTSPAAAGSPFVDYLVPGGGRVGTEVDVVIHGEWLHDTAGLLFLRPGLEVVAVEPKGRREALVRIRIAADCPPGEHLFFLRTRTGLSNLAAFWVGVLPEVDEVEDNGALEVAQPIALGTTVNGLCRREDRDVYAFDVSARGRVSFEVQAARTGSGDLDAVLEILDEDGRVLRTVDDTVLGRADPMGSMILDPGRHFVALRDARWSGAPDCRYRLHLGTFPRPHVAYPPGFRNGRKTELTLFTDTGRIPYTISVKRARRIHELFVEDEGGLSPTPIKLLTNGMPFYDEAAPPERIEKLPFAFAGTISQPGEVDEITFECGKGVSLRASAYAWTVGSPLDPVLALCDGAGNQIAAADDGMGIDSRLNRTTRRGGTFKLKIRDLLRRGGERYVYRIEVLEARPGRSQRLLTPAGLLASVAVVPRGGRLVTAMRGNNLGTEQGLRPRFRGLPEGVTAHVLDYRDDSDAVPVVFEAAPTAPLGDGMARVDLTRSSDDGRKPLRAGFYHSHPLVRVDNNLVYEARGMGRLPCAVVEAPPAELDVTPPAAPLVAGSTIYLRVGVHRHDGFEKTAVRLVGAWRPPGVSFGKLDVSPEKDEAWLAVSASDGAPAATWPVALSALVDAKGRVVSSTDLFDLRVVRPWVSARAGICRVARGASARLHVALDVATAWEGEATLEILGAAKWIEKAPVRITADVREVDIPLEIAADAPLGTRSVYLAVTVPSPDGDLRHRFRTGELRISRASPAARLGGPR